jgi:hypothetical protein
LTGSPQPDKPHRSAWGLTNPDDLHDPLQVGLTIVGVTAAFGGLGWWLDAQLHTFPFLMVLGAVAGLFGIIYLTYMRLRASDEKRERSGSHREPPPRTGG